MSVKYVIMPWLPPFEFEFFLCRSYEYLTKSIEFLQILMLTRMMVIITFFTLTF